MNCAIFRCSYCGRETPGVHFGNYLWGLPNNWLILEKQGILLASCSLECQRKAAQRYLEEDYTVEMHLGDSKEIHVDKPTTTTTAAEDDEWFNEWHEKTKP